MRSFRFSTAWKQASRSEMTAPRTLNEPITVYRIGDPLGRYAIWDPGGALVAGGRWHRAGSAVIYAGEHYSTAMLEKLVHHSGVLPPNQHFIEITVPAGVSYEVVTPHVCPGWDEPASPEALRRGQDWFNRGEACVLVVPSVVARMENNYVFNATHPEFRLIRTSLETPIRWDQRFFRL